MPRPAPATTPPRLIAPPRRRLGSLRRRVRMAATIGLLAAFAATADRGPVGVALGALVVLALAATVGEHWIRRQPGRTPTADSLATPGRLALATAVIVTVGSVVAVVAALLLSAAAPA